MGILDTLRDRIVSWLLGGQDEGYQARAKFILTRRSYYGGDQKRQLKIRPGQFDDNLIVNFARLVVDRAISLLFGAGVEYDLGDGQEQAGEWLEAFWKRNQEAIFLHKLAQSGAEAGQCFVKLLPEEGGMVRLVIQEAALMDVQTDPDDLELVTMYTIQYKTTGLDGKEVAKKQEISRENNRWLILDYEMGQGGQWKLIASTDWGYDFAPIVDWQNLPNPGEYWGLPDLTDDILELQDRLNFVMSNAAKIIRLYAHPQRWSRMFGNTTIDTSPDAMPNANDPAAEINQLQPFGDITAIMSYVQFLRQSMFDITRTIDMSSMADKLGQLTNFGMRVLNQDSLAKLGTKRELYGAALCEICRRAMILANGADIPVEITWGDPLPENPLESLQADQIKQNLGIVSKETLATENGYNWEDEQQRMKDEQAANDNIGAALLSAFNRGGVGAERPIPANFRGTEGEQNGEMG